MEYLNTKKPVVGENKRKNIMSTMALDEKKPTTSISIY